MKTPSSSTLFTVLAIVFSLVVLGGWIANIVKVVGMLGGEVTAMFIARIIGVIAAPLGAFLGFI